jgi:hypothetical protein
VGQPRRQLQLFVLAYNLGNFLRRLALPKEIRDWSLRSVQVKLIKTGARMVRHARRVVFQGNAGRHLDKHMYMRIL